MSDATFAIREEAAHVVRTEPTTSDIDAPMDEPRCRRSTYNVARRHVGVADYREDRRRANPKRSERPRGAEPNAREIFDECLGRYRSLAEWLEIAEEAPD